MAGVRWFMAFFVLVVVAILDNEFRWSYPMFLLCVYGSALCLGCAIACADMASWNEEQK